MLIDEIATLKLLRSRAAHDKFSSGVPRKSLTKEAQQLLADYAAFYKAFPQAQTIDTPAFIAWLRHDHRPNEKPEKSALTRAIVDRVDSADGVTPELERILLDGWRKAALVSAMAEVSVKFRHGSLNEPPEVAFAYALEAYKAAPSGDLSKLRMQPDQFDALGDPSAPGYEWGIEDLNEILGPMRPGYYILIPGRPEIGKTSFVTDQVVHMLGSELARKNGDKVLWLNNEEHKSRIYVRHLSNLLGKPSRFIMERWPSAVARAGDWADRILIEDVHGWDRAAIESLIDQVNPRFVVMHRIDKIPMGDELEGEAQLAAASVWARGVASKGRAVFGVCQAGDGAIGKLYPEEKDIFGSRTRLQSESDAILLIGAESVDAPTRGLNVTRNKLPGGPRSIEEKRYGKCEVALDRVTGRYTSLLYPRK